MLKWIAVVSVFGFSSCATAGKSILEISTEKVVKCFTSTRGVAHYASTNFDCPKKKHVDSVEEWVQKERRIVDLALRHTVVWTRKPISCSPSRCSIGISGCTDGRTSVVSRRSSRYLMIYAHELTHLAALEKFGSIDPEHKMFDYP